MTIKEVVHLELHTSNLAGATTFLSQLLGWIPENVHAAGRSYTALSLGDHLGGGVVECSARPAQWLPYVVVDRLDLATETARQLGATALIQSSECPSGWRSVVNSSACGMIGLWQPKDWLGDDGD